MNGKARRNRRATSADNCHKSGNDVSGPWSRNHPRVRAQILAVKEAINEAQEEAMGRSRRAFERLPKEAFGEAQEEPGLAYFTASEMGWESNEVPTGFHMVAEGSTGQEYGEWPYRLFDSCMKEEEAILLCH